MVELTIIRQVFDEMLQREPDQREAAHYTGNFEGEYALRWQLVNSAEYRERFDLPLPAHKYLDWPYAKLFIASNIKVLYCPIAKNACTSLKRLMVDLSDIDNKEKILGSQFHRATDLAVTGAQLKDLSTVQITEALESDEYLRFAVIREPLSRLLSAYWEKFVLNRCNQDVIAIDTGPTLAAIQQNEDFDPQRGISFSEFVHYVVDSDPEQLNPHWKPQYTYLTGVNYNAFYDFAHMAPLFETLAARSDRSIQVPEVNVTNSGSGKLVTAASAMLPAELLTHGTIHIDSFYNVALKEMVAAYFEKDVALYNACRAG